MNLLVGIAPVAAHPRPATQVFWVDPRSGRDTLCSVRHVVDFGYYRDGNRTPSPDASLGSQFWEDPSVPTTGVEYGPPSAAALPIETSTSQYETRSSSPRPSLDNQQPAPAAVSPPIGVADPGQDNRARFVELMDALEAPSVDMTRGYRVARDALPVNTSSAPNRTLGVHPVVDVESGAIDPSMRILAALAEHPDLLQHYARQIGAHGRGSKRPRYSTVSDALPVEDMTSRLDRQHSFRPSARQQEVHLFTCAEDHRGKSAGSFVDYGRASRATRFVPHPAILSRLYDFLFGVCGLSILHFRRFDLSSQLDYANTSQLNARNFSAGVELPPLPRDATHSDLKAELGVLGSYSDEFFDPHTRRLISSAKDFAEELSDS